MSKVKNFFETLMGLTGAVVFSFWLSLVLIGGVTVFYGVVLWIWLSIPIFLLFGLPLGVVFRQYFQRYAAPALNFLAGTIDAEGLPPKVILLSAALIFSIFILLIYAIFPFSPVMWIVGVLLFTVYVWQSKSMTTI